MANKVTWISQALEFKKIFTMAPYIFQYHAELKDQIKLVKSQGDAMGMVFSVPPVMEQVLLLTAAWENPTYQKLALEFTLDDKAINGNALIKELQKIQLITSHLNKSKGGGNGERRERNVQARMVTASHDTPKKGVCFKFQRGMCTLGSACNFSHEGETKPRREASRPITQKPGGYGRGGSSQKSSTSFTPHNGPRQPAGPRADGGNASSNQSRGKSNACSKCGSTTHPKAECKFDGECTFCKKKGHMSKVCKQRDRKDSGRKPSARIAFTEDDDVHVNMLRIFDGPRYRRPAVSQSLEKSLCKIESVRAEKFQKKIAALYYRNAVGIAISKWWCSSPLMAERLWLIWRISVGASPATWRH